MCSWNFKFCVCRTNQQTTGQVKLCAISLQISICDRLISKFDSKFYLGGLSLRGRTLMGLKQTSEEGHTTGVYTTCTPLFQTVVWLSITMPCVMFELGKYSGPSIKRTPNNFKQTLSRILKWTSYISLYNEPLFSGHLY